MISADPKTFLGYICKKVDQMKPGECLSVRLVDLRFNDVSGYYHNEAYFSPAHRVLENVVGSVYTHSLRFDPANDAAIFERHENTGQRRYESPDHADRRNRLKGT